MKNLLSLLFAFPLLFSCGGSVPNEVLGKFVNPDDGGFVEFKSDGTFIWADESQVMAKGTFVYEGQKEESWGIVFDIDTKVTGGTLKTEWKNTENITNYSNHDNPSYNNKLVLRQYISGAPFVFIKQ